ncbi:MAG TPA: nuclear transport factor 2 family protein [Steroidobacteraceae bacterium]|nr:nuclear transport factor 2 family protein [Steroidobacteraceae bacterium]
MKTRERRSVEAWERMAALMALITLAGCAAHPGQVSPQSARAAALAILAHGAAAWNRGDLDDFMSDYAPDATYVTPRAVVHGRDNIRARYLPRFAPGAVRDSLRFEGLEVDVVGEGALNAIAYYVLFRGDSVTARGPTSLLMRRVGGRWFIVHDHSS